MKREAESFEAGDKLVPITKAVTGEVIKRFELLSHALRSQGDAARAPDLADIHTDRESAATTLWVVLSVINCLKVLLAPYLPFSADRLHRMLGFEDGLEGHGWSWEATTAALPPGRPIPQPGILYTKLDDAVAEAEMARLAASRA